MSRTIPSGRPPRPLLTLLLFVFALLPRLAAIGRYVTPDELIWMHRSLNLRQALLQGAWAETIQSGHPGITTTWVGAIAAQVQLWLDPALASEITWLQQLYWLSTENVEAFRRLYLFLDGARLGVALLSSLGLVLAYVLARPLLGDLPALAATGLLALDPFFAGLSGLLHVDALLATFGLLALLLALLAARTRRSLWAALAGVATALTILTKTPGLLLLAFVPAILAWPLVRRQGNNWRYTVLALGAWLGASVLTALVLLPALWAAPDAVLQHTVGLTGQFVEDAARQTFFLGRMVSDPGPLFYPVVLLFRLSPVAFTGLIVGLAALLARVWRRRAAQEWARVGPLLWLLFFGLVYLAAISLASLKYDRYALPALVALAFVAAWGLVWLSRRLGRRGRPLLGLFLLLQLAYLGLSLPYPLLAYNWLAGGQAAAARVLPVGWGEGAGAAAQWLSGAAAPHHSRLYTTNLPGTAPFWDGPITRLKRANLARIQPADYVLQLDGSASPGAVDLQEREAAHTIDLGAGQQARLYSGLQPDDFGLSRLQTGARELRFGAAVELTAAGAVFLPWPDDVALTLGWRRLADAPISDGYRLQLALVDENDQAHLQQEVPFLNQNDHAPAAWPPDTVQTVSYTLATPPDLPPGEYRLVARLFNAAGEQQGVFDEEGRFVGTQGVLDTVTARPPASQPPLDITHRVPDLAPLVGHGTLPEQLATGQTVTLDLWWQATGQEDGRLLLEVGDAVASAPLQSMGWAPGQTYHIRPSWRVPLEAPAGAQPLRLQWEDENGQALWQAPVTLGQVQVATRERRFDLPANLEPLGIQFGQVATLQGANIEVDEDVLRLQVVWQANEPQATNYTTFVHLRNEQGANVAQGDRPPQPPTGSWAAGEVIVETYDVARPTAGTYTVALGLYDAGNGQRLPVYGPHGTPLPGEEYVLEVVVP